LIVEACDSGSEENDARIDVLKFGLGNITEERSSWFAVSMTTLIKAKTQWQHD
jgi:hypothetical protein